MAKPWYLTTAIRWGVSTIAEMCRLLLLMRATGDILFTVRVEVNPAYDETDPGQPIQVFPAQPHNTSQIAGPLIVEGSLIPGKDRSIKPAVMLTSETDIPLPVLEIETDETEQIDTLNVYNDGSIANDTGTHRLAGAIAQSGLEAVYEVGVGELDLSEFGHINGLHRKFMQVKRTFINQKKLSQA